MELSNQTSKIINEEQRVNAPTVKSMINNNVQLKTSQIKNQIDSLHKKNSKALTNLNALKGKARTKAQMQLASISYHHTTPPNLSNDSISSVLSTELLHTTTPKLKTEIETETEHLWRPPKRRRRNASKI